MDHPEKVNDIQRLDRVSRSVTYPGALIFVDRSITLVLMTLYSRLHKARAYENELVADLSELDATDPRRPLVIRQLVRAQRAVDRLAREVQRRADAALPTDADIVHAARFAPKNPGAWGHRIARGARTTRLRALERRTQRAVRAGAAPATGAHILRDIGELLAERLVYRPGG